MHSSPPLFRLFHPLVVVQQKLSQPELPAPMRRLVCVLVFLATLAPCQAQVPGSMSPAFDTVGRRWIVGGATAGLVGGTLLVLDRTWYSRQDQSSFHVFDDSREWLQVDKTGHGWTAYNAARVNSAMWQWAGLPHNKAVLAGGLTGLAFLTGVEVLDGYSSKWGWSWSDIIANLAGTGLFTGQELAWNEQRIQFKFSFHGNSYSDPVLQQRASDLYGGSWSERMLKDYNAQTYWFSFNIHAFQSDGSFPAWLNIAAGYGAAGMYGGFENRWTDPETGVITDRTSLPRTRQFYLSPDIDFTKIPTNSRLLRTTFAILNAFKCPAPALMLNSKGKLKGYLLYF